MELPSWIPEPAWAGYVEMRKKLKKPMTDRAIELRISALSKLRDEGQDVGAVLDQSTANSWTDLYAVKTERRTDARNPALQRLGKFGQATANNLSEWLEE